MRRSDRKSPSDDNERNNPHSRKNESSSPQELRQLVLKLRSDKDELQDQVVARDKLVEDKARLAEEKAQEAEKTHRLYLDAKNKEQSYLSQIGQNQKLVQEKEQENRETHHLFLAEQRRHRSTLTLYQESEEQYKSTHHLYLEAKTQEQSHLNQLGRFKSLAKEEEQKKQEFHSLFLAEQQRYQSALTLYQKSEEKYKSTVTLYKEEQQRRQSVIFEFKEVQTQSQSYLTLYQEAQIQSQSYLTMYEGEKIKGDELTIKFEEVVGSRDRYLTLYNESQLQLKTERKSKAGIKGWETRRKKENEKLKREISEMASILRDSMERKDEAFNSLYAVAERMDRIQQMVELVDDDTTATNPIGMMKKLQRMWQAIKEVLAE